MNQFLTEYYFQAYGGRPIKCPLKDLDSYFSTVLALFGLERPEAERILQTTHLATGSARFWTVRLDLHASVVISMPARGGLVN